jgi:hypothetical protein
MPQTGLLRARALVEVARVLIQNGRQDGAADHDIGEAIGIGSPKTLSITFGTLLIVRASVRCLIDSCEHEVAGDTDYISGGFKSELVFQLRRKRHGVLVIDDIKSWE